MIFQSCFHIVEELLYFSKLRKEYLRWWICEKLQAIIFCNFLTKRESSQVFMANCVISKHDDSKIKMIKSWWLLFCSMYANLAHISYVRQVPVWYFQDFFKKNLMAQFVNSKACPLQTCTSSTHCQKGSKINNAQFFTLWW